MTLGKPQPEIPRAGSTVYIGVGSNLAPSRNILQGVRLLCARLWITGASRFFRNQALHPPGERRRQPDFLNGVLRARTALHPAVLKMEVLHAVERACGRVRGGDRYAPRTLDLDLLAYGDLAFRNGTMQLPDPEILVHPHVAVPMADVAPDWVPPGSVRSMREIARGLDAGALVEDVRLTRAVGRVVRGGAEPEP